MYHGLVETFGFFQFNLSSVCFCIIFQQWHIPSRTSGLRPRSIGEVTVRKIVKQRDLNAKPTSGIPNKLYNAVTDPLKDIKLPETLIPALSAMSRNNSASNFTVVVIR
jgi:hypothetical protein